MQQRNGGGGAPNGDDERQRLLQSHLQYMDYQGGGRPPPQQPPQNPATNNIDTHKSQPHGISNMIPSENMLPKSYSVNADGSMSYITPVQLGRHELYELVPFTAVFGMQQKERNISKAFANYAADLDVTEADQLAYSQTNQHLSAAELDSRKSHATLFLLEELELDAVVVTTPLMVALIMSGLSQFLVGYNTSVMNSPSSVVFQGHTTFEWSLAVAVFAVGGPFGAVAAGKIIDSRGRRSGMAIVAYSFLFGGLLQTFSLNMLCVTAARFIIGFASGFSSVLVPIYLGELAPPTLRGTLGTLTQFALVIGIFFSDVLAFPFAKEHSWRILFSVTILVSIVLLGCFPFLIESPRWLLGRDRGCRKARSIVEKLRGLRHEHEIEIEVNHFVHAQHAQACDNNDDHTSSEVAFMAMLMDKQTRRLLICSLILQIAQQLSGINAVFYYSTMFFDGLIDSPLLGTTIVGAFNVAATYIALLLMENSNRRTLILWSAGGMFICSIALVLCLLGFLNKMASLFFVILYVCFFEIGLGPIPWLIVAEMFEAKYVATAMSVSCQVNWACNFIVGLIFPYLQESLGAYAFLPFAGSLFMTIIFVIVWLPETKGTTPEDLRDEIVRSLSTMLALSSDTTANPNHSSSVGNPIDVEWRRAMDDLRRQEEENMMRGTFDYGFQPIEPNGAPTPVAPESDWRTRVSGEPGM